MVDVQDVTNTRAASKVLAWRKNPVLFVQEVLGAQPDPWQEDFLHAFPKHNRLCMKASKGPGKTTLLAWCAWNFLMTRPHPKMAATSITKDNLSDGLWTEMSKWAHSSELIKDAFIIQKTRIAYKHAPETWYMSARTWSKAGDSRQQADTLAGLHADYLLFVIDEAGGIPSSVMSAADAGLATGKETKIIMAGNPTHLEGPLYDACTRDRKLWYVQEISGDPDDPKRAPRVDIEWARQAIKSYGRNNPWIQVNVFGKFPESSLNTLLSPNEVADAMKRSLHTPDYSWSQKRLGIDVARYGADSTVIFPRQGLMALQPVVMRNANTLEIAARVMSAKAKWGSEAEYLDGTGGYAAGVADALLAAGQSPVEINFSSRSFDPRYYNKRSEMYFNMADWVKRGGCLPNIPDLVAELTTPTYTFHNSQFRLEAKDQIKERLGRSPDIADALALTFAHPDQPALSMEGRVLSKNMGKLLHDYNPLAKREE